MMKLLSIGTVLLLALARIDHPDAASLGGRVTDENRLRFLRRRFPPGTYSPAMSHTREVTRQDRSNLTA